MLFNYYMLPQVFCISYFCEVTSIEIVYVVRNKKKNNNNLWRIGKRKRKKERRRCKVEHFFSTFMKDDEKFKSNGGFVINIIVDDWDIYDKA